MLNGHTTTTTATQAQLTRTSWKKRLANKLKRHGDSHRTSWAGEPYNTSPMESTPQQLRIHKTKAEPRVPGAAHVVMNYKGLPEEFVADRPCGPFFSTKSGHVQ